MNSTQPDSLFFKRPDVFYTILVPILLLLPLDYFLLTDNSILPWDQAHYANTALRVTATLTESPSAFVRTMLNPIPDRMPGLAWIAAPFAPLGSALDNPARGVLLVTLILNNINLLLLSYILHKHGYAPVAHNATIILATGSTLLVGIGQTFFVEPLMLTGILWLIAMTRGCSFESPTAMLNGLLPILFAILAKDMAPVYMILPSVLPFVSLIFPSHSRPTIALWPTIRIHRTTLVLWLLFLVWVLQMGPAIIRRAAASSTGSVASLYGSHSGITAKARHWTSQLAIGTLPILEQWDTDIIIILVIPIFFIALRYRNTFNTNLRNRAYIISVLQISIIICIFSLADNEDSRFLYGILPYIFLIVATLIHSLVRPYAYIVCVLISLQYLHTYLYVFDIIPSYLQINTYIAQRLTSREPIANIQNLVSLTCTDSANTYYNVVGVDLPNLNQNSMAAYSLLRSWPRLPHCTYTSLGYAENSSDNALKWIATIRPSYIIFPSALPEYLDKDPFNQVSRAVHYELNNSTHSSYTVFTVSPYTIFKHNL